MLSYECHLLFCECVNFSDLVCVRKSEANFFEIFALTVVGSQKPTVVQTQGCKGHKGYKSYKAHKRCKGCEPPGETFTA